MPEPTPSVGSSTAPEVRFSLPAVPANVALVRQALAGLADSLGIDPARAADMKIAITEACTNAVVHAYENHDGPLDVAMGVEHDRLVLSIRDRGPGLRPLPSEGDGPPLGFGLALIASLSDEFGIAGGRHGTEVRMAFALDGGDDAPPLTVWLSRDAAPPVRGVALTLEPGAHAAAVLGRVVSLVAARADFSIDRLSDAQIVSDAIAGAAGAHALDGGGAVRVAIDEHERGFDLVIGPLAPGGGQQLVRDTELPGLGCLLERLADELDVEPAAGGGEHLRARLASRT
ncbi:putative anti-sigma regulatory factor, serine/threonine protein kinase [Conexibacter woesei DSM 14684]|uniref:Putative anti-sigma regulatory factor, serine/threonine protein kinase n=2 Tax=Conexibacter TaxID=191494 RepID=D3F8Y1_CONWI|nr:putative anti-sigma regulatory factor, serine/threonine protein kinase [Conexibacter woesei DSM 14684]